MAIKIETATAIAVIGRQQSCLRKHSLFCRTGPVRNGGGARESQAFTRLSDTRLGPNAPEGAEDHAVPLEAPLHGTRIAMRLPAIASEITKPAQSYRAPGSTLPSAGKIDGLCHSSQTAQFSNASTLPPRFGPQAGAAVFLHRARVHLHSRPALIAERRPSASLERCARQWWRGCCEPGSRYPVRRSSARRTYRCRCPT